MRKKQKDSPSKDITSHRCNQLWTHLMSVLVHQQWKDGIGKTTCLMLPTTHLLHLANEHFHSTTNSLVLEDITTNGATDIFTRGQRQKVCSARTILNNKFYSPRRHHPKWCYYLHQRLTRKVCIRLINLKETILPLKLNKIVLSIDIIYNKWTCVLETTGQNQWNKSIYLEEFTIKSNSTNTVTKSMKLLSNNNARSNIIFISKYNKSNLTCTLSIYCSSLKLRENTCNMLNNTRLIINITKRIKYICR